MSHAKNREYAIAQDHSVILYGMRLPKGSLFGTFKGYSQPLKYALTTFPRDRHDKFTLFVFDNGRWQTASYAHYKKLYIAICGYIENLNLFGHRTSNYTGKIIFPSQAPYGRKQSAIGFKQANKTYLDRGSSGHPIYGDMKRNAANEREYRWDSPKTIVMGIPL